MRKNLSPRLFNKGICLIATFFILIFFSNLAIGQGMANQGFPQGNYTPHGYLDNPYHTLWLNNSGVIRTAPPLGFRFRDHQTIIQLAVSVNGKNYHTVSDFESAQLHSAYHSRNIFSYNWMIEDIKFSATYFLESEQANGLNCEVKIENTGSATTEVDIRALLSIPPLDFDHYTAMVLPENAVLLRRFAEGPVYLLYTENEDAFRKVTNAEEVFNSFKTDGKRDGFVDQALSVHGRFMGGVLGFQNAINSGEAKQYRFCLIQDMAQSAAVEQAKAALSDFDVRRIFLERDDLQFWKSCPQLVGDWPEVWKRGMVYDWETLRMNVRRPIGVYKHHWDGMQVLIPRSVLAETAIDMLTYSYANPEMAKEVIYGTFADAIAPNVPCMREDGSVNMVSESGEECGTAPSWCLPSLAIRSIYARSNDQQWAEKLYPYLLDFTHWWFEHRTHEDSAFFFDNSWESGQDQSARFLVDHKTGGTGVQHIEPVDLTASIADFAELIQRFSIILNKGDGAEWQSLYSKMKKKVNHKFWLEDGYHDIDRRTGKHADTDFSYLLLPYVYQVSGEKQNDWLLEKFKEPDYQQLSRWSYGSPSFQVVIEAMWNLGERELQAEHIAKQLDYVYSQWDRRSWETPNALPRAWGHVDRPSDLLEYHPRVWDKSVGRIDQSTNPFAPPRERSIPMPGVAAEGWKWGKDRPAGMENYGWGATMPMHLIRGIIGYRDLPLDAEQNGFILAPSIPTKLYEFDNRLGITNLHYSDMDFDVTYEVQEDNQLKTTLAWRSPQPVNITVRVDNKPIVESPSKQTQGELSFSLPNYALSEIVVE